MKVIGSAPGVVHCPDAPDGLWSTGQTRSGFKGRNSFRPSTDEDRGQITIFGFRPMAIMGYFLPLGLAPAVRLRHWVNFEIDSYQHRRSSGVGACAVPSLVKKPRRLCLLARRRGRSGVSSRWSRVIPARRTGDRSASRPPLGGGPVPLRSGTPAPARSP